MKTLEQILELITENKFKSYCIDGRDFSRLSQFIPFNLLDRFNIEPTEEYNNEEKWNASIIPFTKENVLNQLKRDVAFAFEKALDQRGISSSLMFEVVRMWNWILEEGLENWDKNDYAMYGLPLFKATAVKYGFDNPIEEDTGRESYYG